MDPRMLITTWERQNNVGSIFIILKKRMQSFLSSIKCTQKFATFFKENI